MTTHRALFAEAIPYPETQMPPALLQEEQLILALGCAGNFSASERRHTILGESQFAITAALNEFHSGERAAVKRREINNDLELTRQSLRDLPPEKQEDMQARWDEIADEVFRGRHAKPSSERQPVQSWTDWLANHANAQELIEFVAQYEIGVAQCYEQLVPELPAVDPELAKLTKGF
jgi:hypothetical protein